MSSSSMVTYTSVYTDSEPWRFRWVSDDEPEAPQSPGHAPLSPDYVPGPEHPPSPDYVPGPEEPGQAPLSPDYVPEPEYPEYLVPSYVEVPIEDQPDDASPTALSPGYVAYSDPEEDPEDDVDDEDEEEASEEEEEEDEEEEHLASADSTALHTIDLVSSVEDKEAFEIDEFAPTPPRSPRLRRAGISVRLLPPMAASIEARIIPSPPLPLLSPPIHTSLTYAEAPLGYIAAKIRLRAASPSTHHQSEIPLPPLLLPSTTHKDDIPEDMPLRKRARFSAPTSRFEVGESSAAAATRQVGQALTSSVDYGFIDTVDASIRAFEIRAMIVVGEDDRALLRAQVSLLMRERIYFRSMASSCKREAVISRQAWAHSKSMSHAMEAQFRALHKDVDVLQRFRELVRTVEAGPQDGPANAGSSC
ncbi:hypothetical protein Tco_1212386 [Tanacetum coccineum]